MRMRHERGLQHANDAVIGAGEARDGGATESGAWRFRSHVHVVEMEGENPSNVGKSFSSDTFEDRNCRLEGLLLAQLMKDSVNDK